jgi:DNA repair photolyase
MVVREIQAKSILSASKIYPYVVNPYTGCQFGCSYCYACYMKRFTGHSELWGTFVDVKTNAADLLEKEILKKKCNTVWISGVCDPYQPLEQTYNLTGRCVAQLLSSGWPIRIQTKSDLILRDIEILRNGKNCDAGLTITTADDSVRRLFEPHAPAIENRIRALKELHNTGIRTFAMIAPLLPGAENLIPLLNHTVDYLFIDRMNYAHADHIYREHGLEQYRTGEYFRKMKTLLQRQAAEAGIPCTICY